MLQLPTALPSPATGPAELGPPMDLASTTPVPREPDAKDWGHPTVLGCPAQVMAARPKYATLDAQRAAVPASTLVCSLLLCQVFTSNMRLHPRLQKVQSGR